MCGSMRVCDGLPEPVLHIATLCLSGQSSYSCVKRTVPGACSGQNRSLALASTAKPAASSSGNCAVDTVPKGSWFRSTGSAALCILVGAILRPR